ncbi:MAG: cyclodeaminase/cyclohydrolase family protein [Planctomycetota bacterium]
MSATEDVSLAAFLDLVAAKTPAPGGGAVAATSGALASAIAQMVVAYSVGKKSLAEHEPELRESLERLERARALLLALGEEDAEAYRLVSELSSKPADDPDRVARWPGAVAAAVRVPQSVLATACDLLRLFERLADRTNRYLASDLAVAAVLAEATARSAFWNVRVNLPMVEDEAKRAALRDECERMVADARERTALVEASVARLTDPSVASS